MRFQTDSGFSPPIVIAICGGVCFVWFIFSSILGHIQYNHSKSRRDNIAAFKEAEQEAMKRRIPKKAYEGSVRKYKVNY
ncbi:MAG: hypothetical protein KDD62_12010 [Bdellovibrionales bacterium]|nr:hypothetical protein [Bdellovibrionales bacterium]